MKYTTPQHLNLKNNMNKVEIRVLKLCILRHEFLPTLQCFFNHSHRNAFKQGKSFYLSFTFGKGTIMIQTWIWLKLSDSLGKLSLFCKNKLAKKQNKKKDDKSRVQFLEIVGRFFLCTEEKYREFPSQWAMEQCLFWMYWK